MSSPIEFTPHQQDIISTLKAKKLKDENIDIWGCDEAEHLRRSIKAHGIKSQNRLCCYCKEKVNSDNFKVWEVEHVLPQSDYSSFTFEPENLAVACPDCNTIKSNAKVTTSKARLRLPTRSELYFIVHPHFDTYDAHILKVGLVYHPRSSKGRKTIEICGLLRYVEKFLDWKNPETIIKLEADAKALQEGIVDKVRVKALIADLMVLL